METLDSVWRQTFRDYEVLIVDDGSTDAYTREVLADITKRFPDVVIIHQENGGPAAARNMGVQQSRGEYFLPLDADDMIHPETLAICLSAIEADENIGMVYTDTKMFGNFSGTLIRPEYDFHRLLMRNYIVVSSLIRKKVWEEVGGYDVHMHGGYEDWEFYIRVGKAGYHGKLVKRPLFYYRDHGVSRNTWATEKHTDNVAYIREKHPDLYAPEHLRALKETWRKKNRTLYWQPMHYIRALRMLFFLIRRYGWRRGAGRVIKN
jgi:glycosyltransferase involved in cell wall biosynthesis